MSDNAIKSFAGAIQVKNAAAGEIAAVVATLSCVDKDCDVLLPGCFPPSSPVKISAYGHDTILEGAPPVGKGAIGVEGDKAVFRGNYFYLYG